MFGCPSTISNDEFIAGTRASALSTANEIRCVKLTLSSPVRARWLFRICRLTSSSLAGTVRTEVAVGTPSEASMFSTIRAVAPRIGTGRSAPSVSAAGAAAAGAGEGDGGACQVVDAVPGGPGEGDCGGAAEGGCGAGPVASRLSKDSRQLSGTEAGSSTYRPYMSSARPELGPRSSNSLSPIAPPEGAPL